MIEIAYLREMERIQKLPKELQHIIQDILVVLDTEYGEDRDKYSDDGGYIIVVEKEEDFQKIKDVTYIDCDDVIPEYVDRIVCTNAKVYTNSLVICNNDYTISLIIPMELAPENLKSYIID